MITGNTNWEKLCFICGISKAGYVTSHIFLTINFVIYKIHNILILSLKRHSPDAEVLLAEISL